MKSTPTKLALLALMILTGLSVATPAHADWYDGRYYHHGHIPHGYAWDPRLGYYVAQPGVVYAAPPGTVVVAQPAPVVVAPAPQVVYAAPPPVIVTEPPPAPIGLSLGVHIR